MKKKHYFISAAIMASLSLCAYELGYYQAQHAEINLTVWRILS